MKNKLWVFGDSFAHDLDGWPSMLANKLNSYVQCFGQSGTSLYYSYHMLTNTLNYIPDQDQIVFFITNPSRLYTSSNVTTKPNQATWDKHLSISGLPSIEAHKQTIKYSKQKFADKIFLENLLDAAEKYYMYLHNQDLANYIHTKIIDDIEKIKSTRNLVTSRDLFSSELLDLVVHCNSRVTQKLVNKHDELYIKYQETPNLLNHFSIENNKLIADHIYNFLQSENKNKMQKQDLVQLSPDQWQTYFEPRL